MEELGSEGISHNSMSDAFADSLMDNEIVDAVDLTHEINSHQSGEERLRLNCSTHSFGEEHIMKKKKSEPIQFLNSPKNSLPPNHMMQGVSLHSNFSLPPPSMMVPTSGAFSNQNDLPNGNSLSSPVTETDLATLGRSFTESNSPDSTTIVEGVTYNNRGYEICGALNKFNKPCQRIGRNCPFHGVKDDPSSQSPQAQPQQNSPTSPNTPVTSSSPNSPPSPLSPISPLPASESKRSPKNINSPNPPIKKGPYKRGWTKEEHIRFLKGLQYHGKGSWKEISAIVGSRTPSQIQVHAHRYFLRQQQGNKNKRSIHDFTMDDLTELESHQVSQINAHAPFPTQTTLVEVVAQPTGNAQYFVQPSSNTPIYTNGNQTYTYSNPSQQQQQFATITTYNNTSYNPQWNYAAPYQPNYANTVQGGAVNTFCSQVQSNLWNSQQYSNTSYTNNATHSNGVPFSVSNGSPPAFMNGTQVSYSTVTPGSYTNNPTSNSYRNGTSTSYNTNNGNSYSNGASSYSNGVSSFPNNGVTFLNGQLYLSNSQNHTTNGQQTFASNGTPSSNYNLDSYRMVIPQLIDSQVSHHDENSSGQEHYRKQEDRDFNHSDYNKELQGEKGLLLKDLPDIFLRSEIANEPIK